MRTCKNNHIDRFISYVNESLTILESANDVKTSVADAENKAKAAIEKQITKPQDVISFMHKNQDKYEDACRKMPNEKKSILKTAWKYAAYAIKQGMKFMLKYWNKLLVLLFIIYIGLYFSKIFSMISSFLAGYLKAGAKIDAANIAAGGLGGWTCAGLGGGLR